MKIFYSILLLCSTCLAHTVTLSWQLSDAVEPTQSVYRSIACTGTYVKQAQVTATTVEWTDSNVKNGQTYCYYVALSAKGVQVGDSSNVVQVTIPEE